MDTKLNLEELIKSSEILSGINNIINSKTSIVYKDEQLLIDTIRDYKDVCRELGEKQYSIHDFLFIPEEYREKQLATIQLNQLGKLFNGDWIIDWLNTTQYKWLPYFKKDAGSAGLVCYGSDYFNTAYRAGVVYFKSEKLSNYIGKQFINIYEKLI